MWQGKQSAEMETPGHTIIIFAKSNELSSSFQNQVDWLMNNWMSRFLERIVFILLLYLSLNSLCSKRRKRAFCPLFTLCVNFFLLFKIGKNLRICSCSEKKDLLFNSVCQEVWRKCMKWNDLDALVEWWDSGCHERKSISLSSTILHALHPLIQYVFPTGSFPTSTFFARERRAKVGEAS